MVIHDPNEIALALLVFLWLSSPLWVPIVLAGYWLGRRTVSLRSVLVFLALESIAIASVAPTLCASPVFL